MSDFLVPKPSAAVAPAAAAPTFAVVIPAYQAASTVAEAVDSVLGQTVAPEEIIVVDDGSTDRTAEVLSPYLDRIKLVRKSNGGGASALNAGVDAASSDFTAVLDADDLYLPERLEELRRLAIERPDLDVLSTDAFFESAGRLTGRFNEANRFPVTNQREAILRVCYLFAPAVRRRRLLEVGGFDEQLRIAYDWDCWIRVLLSGASAGLVDRPLMRYRLHSGSLSANRQRALEERVTVLLKVASATHSLSAAERTALQRSLSAHRATARLARAQTALLGRAPGARRYALGVAIGQGFPLRTRAEALFATLAPAHAAKRVAADVKTGTTRLLTRPTGTGNSTDDVQTRRMRVAVVVGDLFGPHTAVGSVAQFEAMALAEAGHEVVCVTATGGELPRVRVEAVGRWISRLDALRRVSAEVSFAGAVALRLRGLQPLDMIVVHGGGPCLGALPFGRRHGIPTVLVLHAMIWDRIAGKAHALRRLDVAFYRGADRFALRADFTLSVSQYIRAIAIEHGANPSHAMVRRNPVDTTAFTPAEGPRPVDVLYVGRLSPEKGVDTLVDAVKALPPMRVIAIGDGRLRGMLEERAQGRVQFVGPVKRAELADHYRAAKICVVPSRSDSFPLVVLEALASGTPVVGAEVGGIPELIAENENGWLFPSGDADALAQTIARALASDLAAYSVRARSSAERDSLERFRERVPVQYEEMLELHRAAAARPRRGVRRVLS